jgi:hypothetical protein
MLPEFLLSGTADRLCIVKDDRARRGRALVDGEDEASHFRVAPEMESMAGITRPCFSLASFDEAYWCSVQRFTSSS